MILIIDNYHRSIISVNFFLSSTRLTVRSTFCLLLGRFDASFPAFLFDIFFNNVATSFRIGELNVFYLFQATKTCLNGDTEEIEIVLKIFASIDDIEQEFKRLVYSPRIISIVCVYLSISFVFFPYLQRLFPMQRLFASLATSTISHNQQTLCQPL